MRLYVICTAHVQAMGGSGAGTGSQAGNGYLARQKSTGRTCGTRRTFDRLCVGGWACGSDCVVVAGVLSTVHDVCESAAHMDVWLQTYYERQTVERVQAC